MEKSQKIHENGVIESLLDDNRAFTIEAKVNSERVPIEAKTTWNRSEGKGSMTIKIPKEALGIEPEDEDEVRTAVIKAFSSAYDRLVKKRTAWAMVDPDQISMFDGEPTGELVSLS